VTQFRIPSAERTTDTVLNLKHFESIELQRSFGNINISRLAQLKILDRINSASSLEFTTISGLGKSEKSPISVAANLEV